MSTVNGWLIERRLLTIAASPVVGLVAETGCAYFESVAVPEAIEAGLAVDRLGRASVRYRIGIFRAEGALAAAQGHFVHLSVDRATQRPVPIPEATRTALGGLLAAAP